MALALLGRQHVLMTGPPGTAKSELTKAVLGRLLDARTGERSLFERQFSESTVLTDLVGAIDFKPLTETGRTEHFTDEGLIGSVHAFLDEVLDGRDMLLRSTLNLLGEREFKQGKKTVRGRVECAFMTTNRYLAEVLEDSRESLLAFIDRIAYVSFIAQGLIAPESLAGVLRARLAGPRRELGTALTIQDLDLLQEVTESVPIAPELCERLAGFFQHFAAETAAAVRADPEYFPSRYLSTRTQVRAGAALRSIVVYDRIVHDPQRPLAVLPRDFSDLRLLLSLAGPTPREPGAELDRQDPREARQLRIVRTERDIFRRCLERVDRTPVPIVVPDAVALEEAELRRLPTDELLAVADRCGTDAATGKDVLRLLTHLVGQRIAEAGLGAKLPEQSGATVAQVSALVQKVEKSRGFASPLAVWLREQLLLHLDAEVAREVMPADWSLLDTPRRAAEVGARAATQLERIERLAEARVRLVEVGMARDERRWTSGGREASARRVAPRRAEAGVAERGLGGEPATSQGRDAARGRPGQRDPSTLPAARGPLPAAAREPAHQRSAASAGPCGARVAEPRATSTTARGGSADTPRNRRRRPTLGRARAAPPGRPDPSDPRSELLASAGARRQHRRPATGPRSRAAPRAAERRRPEERDRRGSRAEPEPGRRELGWSVW